MLAPQMPALPYLFATIPWFQFPVLRIGPLSIQSFGLLAALGVLTAAEVTARASARLGEDPEVVRNFALVGLLAGILGGHLVDLFFYHPEDLSRPRAVLEFWQGLSSMGGLLGGILAAAVYFRRKRIPFQRYADAFALGVPLGWGVARLGCFSVHDHPGIHTSFPLAVQFPDGPRHDLGLYGALLLFAITGLVWLLQRRGLLRDQRLAVVAVVYGVARFLLDFLRTREVVIGPDYYARPDGRLLGLTFAQWFTLLLVGWGAQALLRQRHRGAPRPAP